MANAQTNPGGTHLDCASLAPIAVGLPAHSAPLGMSFLEGSSLPATWSEYHVVVPSCCQNMYTDLSFGPIAVPAEHYWGAQTQRSLQNFKIGGQTMPLPLIHAFGALKKAAALANMKLGILDTKLGDAIVKAAEEVMSGKLDPAIGRVEQPHVSALVRRASSSG